MSEFHFGVGTGRVSRSLYCRIARIAEKCGADFVNPSLPEGPRYWFSGPNRGEPFDRALSHEVYAALEAEGIPWPPV